MWGAATASNITDFKFPYHGHACAGNHGQLGGNLLLCDRIKW